MPHITEGLARDLRQRMRPKTMMVRRWWTDDEPPYRYLESFPRTDHVLGVTFASNGTASVSIRTYDRGNSRPTTVTELWAPDDVIAIVATKPLGGSSETTYAHHDDRLILPNGHLQAYPGTMHRRWSVVVDDNILADGVSVLEGRKFLADLTP